MSKTNFTVAQLIELLQTFPQELPVLVSGYESGYEDFYRPHIMNLTHHPENMYFDGEYQNEIDNENNAIDAVVLARVIRDD